MEITEITESNVSQYLEDCLSVQRYLVKSEKSVREAQFIETAKDNHTYFMGVINGNRLVGMGVLGKIVHPVNTTGYINNVVVHPDMRGQGLFTDIMDNLEQKAKDWGCTDLALTCSRENVQGMYKKRGYTHKQTNFYIRKI